jgi:hypothetical protein
MFTSGLKKIAASFTTQSALKRIADAKRRGMKRPDRRLGLVTMKIASDKVCMTKKDFVHEHKKLVRELRHPKKKELKREADEQSKELKEKS